MLGRHKDAFVWTYQDMQCIYPQVCTHHIYMKDGTRLVQELPRRLNPTMREIVKEEIQKLLKVDLTYPISDSEWVSPLVLVPKKKGKSRIYIDYRELNKVTKKGNFPLPYIDQVLDNVLGKKYFSFIYDFRTYNQI